MLEENSILSFLPLNFCNKKHEIETDTCVAGIARFSEYLSR